ncbi:hypothetical protein SLEP1_g28612 [Rubroshorea leprosula]|uniref:Uncharacterized protein n=1 Tax=Rubroshorea leprosula TaxID=152421 RepID=A0AAV5K3K4_9ROSI|nr:hypothetical protein SLEP1_g28612 [Rubroshorea leprosula]
MPAPLCKVQTFHFSFIEHMFQFVNSVSFLGLDGPGQKQKNEKKRLDIAIPDNKKLRVILCIDPCM